LSLRRTIWLDAASPAQVLWYSGLTDLFARKGLNLFITTRSHADTAQLAHRFLPWIDAVVEGHDAGGTAAKMRVILERAQRLRNAARRHQDTGRMLAISHNSYSHILAARSLRVPVLTSMDFEGQKANHLAFRLAERVLLPEAFPEKVAKRQGASPSKVSRYRGIKEALYLDTDTGRRPVSPSDEPPIAVVRPEADFATYQPGENPLLPLVVDHLVQQGARVVLLPRGEAQRNSMNGRWRRVAEIGRQAVDGPELLRDADLFVGAGGTMTREAAILGTPCYSIYRGNSPAVDRYLEGLGLMVILRDASEVSNIDVTKKDGATAPLIGSESKESIIEAIESFIDSHR